MYIYIYFIYIYIHIYTYIYIYIYIIYIYILQINLPVVFKPANFIQKGKTNVLVCATFIMKKQPFILEKKCSFQLADVGIFLDFLLLEKKKIKTCSVDSCTSSICKKDQENQSEKFDCPIHQIKKCKKRQDSFRECSFYIHSKAHTAKLCSNKKES